MCLCFLVTSAMAEPTCNGGTPITSHKATDAGCDSDTCNEHTFCKSNNSMNWWSAFTWCESQGRKLADFATMCPGVHQSALRIDGACVNLNLPDAGDGYSWSSLANGDSSAFIVTFSGFINAAPDRLRYYYALCE